MTVSRGGKKEVVVAATPLSRAVVSSGGETLYKAIQVRRREKRGERDNTLCAVCFVLCAVCCVLCCVLCSTVLCDTAC